MRLTLIALLLAGCGLLPLKVYDGQGVRSPRVEQDRVAEAKVAAPTSGTITHGLWYSGWFETDAPVDVAILREYCRPGHLATIVEQDAGKGYITAYIYTPRTLTFTCNHPVKETGTSSTR